MGRGGIGRDESGVSGFVIAFILVLVAGLAVGFFSGLKLDDFALILLTVLITVGAVVGAIMARGAILGFVFAYIFWVGFAGAQYLI